MLQVDRIGRVFANLPNELVKNQRQPIDCSDELSKCLRREPRQILGAERVSNLLCLEPAQLQLANRRCSAQALQRVWKQRFAATVMISASGSWSSESAR